MVIKIEALEIGQFVSWISCKPRSRNFTLSDIDLDRNHLAGLISSYMQGVTTGNIVVNRTYYHTYISLIRFAVMPDALMNVLLR